MTRLWTFLHTFVLIMFTTRRSCCSLYIQILNDGSRCSTRRFLGSQMVDNNNSNNYYKLPRLYIPSLLAPGAVVSLDEENINYVKNVMRLKNGSQLRVFNPQNGEFSCSIRYSNPNRKNTAVDLEVLHQLRSKDEASNIQVKLLFSPIKKDKIKLLLEKCTELGVESFQPIITQNTNVEYSSVGWQRGLNSLLVQSSEQCERISLPTLLEPMTLAQLLNNNVKKQPGASVLFIGRERGNLKDGCTVSLLTALDQLQPLVTSEQERIVDISVLIGPEGGFTKEEFQLMESCSATTGPGMTFVSLGDNVLRAETASIAAISIITAWAQQFQRMKE